MTSLDIRDEAGIRQAKADSLRHLHTLGLSVSEQCESLLIVEQTIRLTDKDYQISNSAVWGILGSMIGYCEAYADISGDNSLYDNVQTIYNLYFNDFETNHEIIERIRSLAKELATRALNAWLRW